MKTHRSELRTGASCTDCGCQRKATLAPCKACGSRRITLRRRRGEVAGKVIEPPQTAPTEGTDA